MLSGSDPLDTYTKFNYSSIGSRAEMEKFEKELPKHVKEELRKGKLRYADTVIYSIKPVTSKVVKMFETHDDRQVGICNIANAKLPKNQCFLVSGIQVFVGFVVAAGSQATTDEILANTMNLGIQSVVPLFTGEFSFKANQKTIVPETSNKVFMATGAVGQPPGYYKLDNPRLIHDEWLIEFTFELGTTRGLPANSYVFLGLRGTITTP